MEPQVTFDEYRAEWLGDVQAGNPSTTELGHRFARKLMTQWRDIDDASDDLIYCDGAGDGGVDIAYLYRGEDADNETSISAEGDTWYLVQSKYGSAFRNSSTLLEEGQKLIDTLDGQRPRLSSLVTGLMDRIKQFQQQSSDRDKIVLVFATELPLTDEQKRTLNDIRAMGRERLGATFDVEAVSIETIYLRQAEDVLLLTHISVPIMADLATSGNDLLVGATSLLNLYDFLKHYRAQTQDLDQLYEKNVRRFLGSRGRVNKAMEQTLLQTPERFGLYNNGITIVVNDFETQDGGSTLLTEPYIVNGCQTTRTIWEVCRRRLEAGGTGTDPDLEDWCRRAGEGVVVTKIVKVGATGEGLLQEITRYTNTQNAVREKDFITLTSDFHSWAKQMAEHYGVFLEVQRGGWDSRRAYQRQNPSAQPHFTEAANAFDLLKVYGAGWLGEAGTAFSKNGPFLPNGAIFKQVLSNTSSDEPFGTDDLYAAYRLQIAADLFQFGRSAVKISRRQSRFLFYMITVELLKRVLVRTYAAPTASTKQITEAFLKIFTASNTAAAEALLNTSIDVVDEYLTPGTEDSVFNEPSFLSYNNDLNGYLKWDKIGKSDEYTPRLRSLLALTTLTMRRVTGGQPSPSDLITSALRS